MAGRDWLRGFSKQHEDFAIRHPLGTNIARAVDITRPHVRLLFDLFKSQLEMSTYTSARIWNMYEIRMTNMQKPGDIVATKGVSPMFFVWLRKSMAESLMTGVLCKSSHCCRSSGWADSDLWGKEPPWGLMSHTTASTGMEQLGQYI
ncbi:hypothetical protein NP493_3864g00004 [Ridgeia piscesae]|uniref:Uncharacterized protein n=1 Tax=Ridgeia piscesae TaxID=27915 RepID=A0AAD9J525_RIDPI|nr:hypothetical protein NP493_3864g00004 [Ridgeia piscesae]